MHGQILPMAADMDDILSFNKTHENCQMTVDVYNDRVFISKMLESIQSAQSVSSYSSSVYVSACVSRS